MSDVDLGIDGISDVEQVGQTENTTTYRVRDTGTGQHVQLTIINAAGLAPESIERFGQEQRVLAEISSHPNLLTVLGTSRTASGDPFVVTDIPGATTLASRASGSAPMTGPDVLRVGVRIAGALESAHRGGVVHGDFRPENVALADNGEPMVTEVGLSTLTGSSVGHTDDPRRLEHVSPEVLDGAAPTPASDQYSLAAAMFRLLAGEAAFVRPDDTSVIPVIKRIATEPAPDLKSKGVPPAAAEAVHKALNKAPADRFANLQDFARALQQAEVALTLPMTDLTVLTPSAPLATTWGATTTGDSPAPTPSPAPAPAAAAPPAPVPPPTSPPPLAAKKSRTPLFVGIAAVVVLAIVAAVLLTRGGSDKKASASSSSSSSAASRSASSSSSQRGASGAGTDASDGFAPAGFITVNHSFEHGDVELFVPNDWTQNEPVDLANGEPRLQAAPDVAGFVDGTFAHSGVQLDAFGVTENGVANADDLDALVDNFASQPAENGGWPGGPLAAVCTPGARGNYADDFGTTSDGGFAGRFRRFDSCRGAGAIVVVFATPADKSFIVQMVVGITSPDDEAALPTIVGSVIVVNFP